MRRLSICCFLLLSVACTRDDPRLLSDEAVEETTGEIEDFDLTSGPRRIVPIWEGAAAEVRRDRWIRARIDSLQHLGWETIQHQLLAAGTPSIPLLIENLDRTEPCHRTVQGGFSVTLSGDNDGFELGQIVHHLLVDMITHWSDYDGDAGHLPLRKDTAGWRAWYGTHGGGLKIAHRRD